MSNDDKTKTNVQIILEEDECQVLKPYEKPTLEELGDLRALTLGGTFGTGDSAGDWCVEQPVGGGGGIPC